MADMLLACRKGWRSIDLTRQGPLAVEALIKHCQTLETLSLRKAYGMTSTHIQRILSSSPQLATFITLDPDALTDESHPESTYILATYFIDRDPSTNTFKPWACESSLRVLRVKISGVPRPDIARTFTGQSLREGMVEPEFYPGESQVMQRQVYERLARLKQLGRLELGHEDRNLDDGCWTLQDLDEVGNLDDGGQQYDCLDMNLMSGVKLLEGLKNLKVLGVVRMATSIGVGEVKWMTQAWPKLRRLDGLNVEDCEEAAAHKWLSERCPWIQSHVCYRIELLNDY